MNGNTTAPRRRSRAWRNWAGLIALLLVTAGVFAGANGTFTTTVKSKQPPGSTTQQDTMKVSYMPNGNSPCTEILIVQTCRMTDQDGNVVQPKDLTTEKFKFLQPDKTPDGTFVDHLPTEKDPYYNGLDDPQDAYYPGYSFLGLNLATLMSDIPNLSGILPAGVTKLTCTFEDCAVCRTNGKILDCITWTYVVDTAVPGMGTISDATGPAGPPSEEFKKALAQFRKTHKFDTKCPEEVAEKKLGLGDLFPGLRLTTPTTPHRYQSTQFNWLILNQGGTDLHNVPWQATYTDGSGSYQLAAGTIPTIGYFDYAEVVFFAPPVPVGTTATVTLSADPANAVPEYDEGNNTASVTLDDSGIVYEGAPRINEIRIDQPGPDTDEYFEIRGTPFASLDNLTYVVVGDGTASTQCGVIESAIPLSTYGVPPDGYFAAVRGSFPTLTGYDVTDVSEINFENLDNVTHMLVAGYSGALNQDLDLNDDGILDVTPWTSIVDWVSPYNALAPNCAALGNLDWWYSPFTVGPSAPGTVPMMIWRCEDTGAWRIGNDNLAPVGDDTPGRPNPTCGLQPPVVHLETRTPCVPLAGQTATVTDSIAGNPLGVILVYSVGDGPSNGIPMSAIGGNKWQGTLPAQPVDGTRVNYHVTASNGDGYGTGAFTGYFVGTTGIAAVRVNGPDGVNLYRYYGVRVRGNATVAQGIFNPTSTDFYVQDATGGIDVFRNGAVAGPVGLGDDVEVVGSLDQFSGKLEIVGSTTCGPLAVTRFGSGSPPAPRPVFTCDIDEPHEGLLVRAQVPVIDTAGHNSPYWQANQTYRFLNCSGDPVEIFIDGDTDIDGTPILSTSIDVTGLSGQFDRVGPFTSGYEIVPRSLADILYMSQSQAPAGAEVREARLYRAAPNPFTSRTVIQYDVPGRSGAAPVHVRLRLYDVAGRLIATLVDEERGPGSYAFRLDAAQLGGRASGMFFYQMEIGGRKLPGQKLLLVK